MEAFVAEFTDRTAIVTGGGSGIGAAIARALGREGANVLVTDIDEDAAREVVKDIEQAGGTAAAMKHDVASPEAAEDVVRRAQEQFGALHLAVNNAGIGGELNPVADYGVEAWNRVIAINLSGVFYGMKYQIPAIESAGGGAIVNMASILGSVGTANSPAYVAAKHGVLGLTKAAALEYASSQVRINAIGPGYIDTPLLEVLPDDARAGLVKLHPLGRLGSSEEVAELALFLLSERASFITGSYHLVDGGYTAR